MLYSDEIAVYDKILYLIIPTLPQKYGIESTILAAYDLEAGRPIDFCILEKCQPLAFYLAGDRLYVLTNPYDCRPWNCAAIMPKPWSLYRRALISYRRHGQSAYRGKIPFMRLNLRQ